MRFNLPFELAGPWVENKPDVSDGAAVVEEIGHLVFVRVVREVLDEHGAAVLLLLRSARVP